jgi:hypothetical protein
MTYKVTFSSGNNYSVKYSQPNKYKTSFYRSITPMKLEELADVQISGNNDQYVLMYDESLGKWRDRNPDVVLSAASNTESTQPGLPGDFVNTLDVDLDNKIDLDAGTF